MTMWTHNGKYICRFALEDNGSSIKQKLPTCAAFVGTAEITAKQMIPKKLTPFHRHLFL